jgi:heme A synthase
MKLSVIKFLVTLLYVLSVHINNAVFFKEQNIFKEQNTEQLCEVRCMRNVGLIYLCILIYMGQLYGTYVDNKLYIIYNPYKSGSALRVQSLILLSKM